MKKIALILLCIGLATSILSFASAADIKKEQNPRIINIINFVRDVEPRQGGLKDVLYNTVATQIDCMRRNQVKGTFLLQYDALIDPRYQKLMKDNSDVVAEVGGWWEITQPHVEAIGLTWRGRYPWDWHANVGFATGYTPEERLKLVDEYMAKFKEIFGKYPSAVGSWFIDAKSLAYMTDKYGIEASCNCRDQQGTDGYTLWGGYWAGGYYPSRKNAYMPAQTDKGKINVPVFRMLGSDPVRQYDAGIGTPHMPVNTLEPVFGDYGGSAKWVDWFMDVLSEQPCMGFTYAQAGQENSFTWNGMHKGYEIQMKKLGEMQRKGEIQLRTLSETGKWYKSKYRQTAATAMSALANYGNEDKQSVWYNCRYYRANLVWENGTMRFRDIHIFNEDYPSLYIDTPGTSAECHYFTLPIIDGRTWSTATDIAGLRLKYKDSDGNWAPLRGTQQQVIEKGNKLIVTWTLDNNLGTLTVSFTERKIEMSISNKSLEWCFTLNAKEGAKLPFTLITADVLRARQNGFSYSIRAAKGSFKDLRSNHDGEAFSIIPSKGKITLDMTSKK